MGIVGIGIERLRVERRRIDVHAMAGAEYVGEQEANDQRDCGHHLEIDQRLDADPPNFLEVTGTGDAMHDHAEHDRCDDHRNQLQEGIAENLQADGKIGNRHSKHNSQEKRGKDLNKQGGIQRLACNRRRGGDGRHRTLSPIGSNRSQQQITVGNKS